MSIKPMQYVFENIATKGSNRLMLLAIADRCDDEGECYPGISRLAKKCNVQRRQAINLIQELERLGELRVIESEGVRTNGGTTNRYHMVGYMIANQLKTLDDQYRDITPKKTRKTTPVQQVAPRATNDKGSAAGYTGGGAAGYTQSQVVFQDKTQDTLSGKPEAPPTPKTKTLTPQSKRDEIAEAMLDTSVPRLFKRDDFVKVVGGKRHVDSYGDVIHDQEEGSAKVHISIEGAGYTVNYSWIVLAEAMIDSSPSGTPDTSVHTDKLVAEEKEKQAKKPSPLVWIKRWVAINIWNLKDGKVPKHLGYMVGNWGNAVVAVHKEYGTTCEEAHLEAFKKWWNDNKDGINYPESRQKVERHYTEFYEYMLAKKAQAERVESARQATIENPIDSAPPQWDVIKPDYSVTGVTVTEADEPTTVSKDDNNKSGMETDSDG